MSELSYAWDDAEPKAGGRSASLRLGSWSLGAFAGLLSIWVFLYLSGLFTTLGSASGSERHGADAIRISDGGGFGIPTMYLAAGQTAWWDYEVEVQGEGGIRIEIAKSVPTPDFIVKAKALTASGKGRFEVVAPESGFYTFSRELVPIGRPLNGANPGSTVYSLKWGVG
jgi:hypothetical protein